MAGPILALQFILIIIYVFIAVILFWLTIVKRKKLFISIPTGFVFLLMTFFAFKVYTNNRNGRLAEAKKFLGDYKLNQLDREKCENCKVRLYENFHYDILKENKVVGQGNWNIETAVDIPGYFLKIENGPNYVIWESERLIESIDRTTRK
jgi:hypothetical protein